MIGAHSKSFRTRLVVAAAATVMFVQLISAVVDVYTGYSRLSTEMDAKGRLLVEQTATVIARPLWDFDDNLVAEILGSLHEIDGFTDVTVVSDAGETEFNLISDEKSSTDTLRIYNQPIVMKNGDTEQPLGMLEITISTSNLWAALWWVIFHKTTLVVVSLCFASAALYVVLGHLSKPLEALRNAVYAIEREEFDLPVPGRNRKDEIGALANALDGLREREAELLILRRASNEKSQRESRRIRQALQSTRDAVILVDETNTIIFTNVSAETYFPGFSVGSELVEQSDINQPRANELRAALLSRREVDNEITFERNGTVLHFQARTGPIVDSLGRDLGGLFLASDFTEQFERSKEALYLASHDPLTGLLNRREMDAILTEWVSDPDLTIGIMLIDLDYFKAVNDTFGHHLGDKLLVSVAQKFGHLAGPDDLVVRLGGDEFAIITQGTNSKSHLHKIASTAIDDFKTPVHLEDRIIQASISAGIATSKATGADVQMLMRHADLALYEAKKQGAVDLKYTETRSRSLRIGSKKMAGNLRTAYKRQLFIN